MTLSSSPHSPKLGAVAPRTRRSGMRSRSTQLFALRFGWVVLVVWFEVGDFFASLSSCRFPDAALKKTSSHTPTHVVFLADPHVPHPHLSHPSDGRPWVNAIRQTMGDLFMRKSWRIVTRLGRIDAVVVVGDMLDCGRDIMTDDEYDEYHALFRSIFKLPSSTPMYYVPGNHDIPLGKNRYFSPQARKPYIEHFGETNMAVPIANHTLILLDAIRLVEEDYRRYHAEMQFGEWRGIDNGVIEFVKLLGKERPPSPILVSHIPLARSATTSCGPHREYGRIQKGVGNGYQNLLGTETSRFLLDQIKPSIVFSGDDHDYCEVHHGGVKEVTIKSFSSSAGIRKPGFQLLSLVPPKGDQPSLADRPCFLPDQMGVYTNVYTPIAILTFAFLLLTNMRAAWIRSVGSDLKPRYTPTDEKRRPPPLTTRKSAQHLQALGLSSPRERFNASSAPASPAMSPRLSLADDDPEYAVGGVSSPSLSRRGSYVSELNGDYLSAGVSVGSTNRRSPMMSPMSALPSPTTSRRPGTLPRVMSASDWASATKQKSVSVLSLGAEDRNIYIARIRGFLRWLWRSRNSVFITTWRELLTIAVPAAAAWVVMNALFFWSP